MIAAISDSHVPTRKEQLPEEFIEKMKEADKITHAGDFAEKEVYNGIDEYGELIAVKGNCDFFELPNSETFTVNGVKFGVYHGTGITPRGDHDTLQKIAQKDLEVDILITGHTHNEEITSLENCIILNPGSCTGAGGGTARKKTPTMLEIQVKEDKLEVKLLEKTDGEVNERKAETLKV
jgi:putative phosphoesterase